MFDIWTVFQTEDKDERTWKRGAFGDEISVYVLPDRSSYT